jgi:phage protein D
MMIGFGGAGSASAPDALRPSVDALPADAPAPGMAAIWTPAPALRVPKAAATASAGADASAGANARRVRARCTLLPKLRPGTVIEVQDVPDGLSGGSWIVTRVTHRLRPGQGGITIFEGISGEGGGLGALLASALAAIGSLF